MWDEVRQFTKRGRGLWFHPTLFHVQQGVEDVKQHKWFKAVDWDAVLQRKLVVSGEGRVGIVVSEEGVWECGDTVIRMVEPI